MKRRLISLVLVLMLVMTAGCGKKSTTKKLKTEDLDETTLQGMAKDITNGQIKIAEGTMYPILYKLQDQGYISDRQVKVGKRQTRVYYHLEPAGKDYLSQLTHDYYQMVNYPSHAVQ